MQTDTETPTLPEQIEQFERNKIRRALLKTGGNITATAERLGVERWRIYRKMFKYGWMAVGRNSRAPIDREALCRLLRAEAEAR